MKGIVTKDKDSQDEIKSNERERAETIMHQVVSEMNLSSTFVIYPTLFIVGSHTHTHAAYQNDADAMCSMSHEM